MRNRKAFAELYAGQAGELAEKMARLRSKEAAARDAFRFAVERYIPAPVLAGLGLAARPPHCVVSVPQPDAGLAAVTPEDLKRAPAPQQVSQPCCFPPELHPDLAPLIPSSTPDAGLAAVTPEDLKRAPAPQQVRQTRRFLKLHSELAP